MDHRIFRICKNESLEIKEGQIVISQEISTFTSVNIGLLQSLIKIQGDREVFHCLCQNT